eukprot:4562618-Pleurochrysis_carterae.AAC.1
MQENNNTTDIDTVLAPTRDSWQLYLRASLDDIAAWLPSQHSNYSPHVEYGYVLTSQGSVAAYTLDMRFTADPVYWWPTPMTCPHRAIPCSLRRAPLLPRTCRLRLVRRDPNRSPRRPKPMCPLLRLLLHPSQPR